MPGRFHRKMLMFMKNRSLIHGGFLVLLIALSSCGNQDQPSLVAPLEAEPAPAKVYNASVKIYDGSEMAFTVFVPPLAAGEKVPLILHGHGWGASRVNTGDPATLSLGEGSAVSGVITGMNEAEFVERFWQAGYGVISFDQRGWGESGGLVSVMDPYLDIRGISTIIDWAEDNLDWLAYQDNDPVVGATGLSYGGGYQLMLATQDDRLDAMTPFITWNDLRYSLAPVGNSEQGVPKSLWLDLLVGSGTLISANGLEPFISQAFNQALTQNTFNPKAAEQFYFRSPAYWCNAGQMRPVPTLLVQGMRDILFNFNEALWNQGCLQKAGAPVRLLTMQAGHTLPVVQQAPGTAFCGEVDALAAIVSWMDVYLKGKDKALEQIPEVCLSLDDKRAINLEEVPLGGQEFEIAATSVASGRGAVSKVFLPLYTAESDEILAGVPLADLELVVNEGDDAIVFVGVGHKPSGSTEAVLIDEQTLPLRGAQTYQGTLVGVGEALKAGDQVGLLIQSSSPVYIHNGARQNFTATISGKVQLPLQ
jgi:ABC-2 type transport system ATP-binding protein